MYSCLMSIHGRVKLTVPVGLVANHYTTKACYVLLISMQGLGLTVPMKKSVILAAPYTNGLNRLTV